MNAVAGDMPSRMRPYDIMLPGWDADVCNRAICPPELEPGCVALVDAPFELSGFAGDMPGL